MGIAEMESPLLRVDDDEAAVVVVVPENEEGGINAAESDQDPEWRGRDLAGLVVFMCCICAILLVSSSCSRCDYRLRNIGGDLSSIAGVGDDPEAEFDYFDAQRTSFHFQPAHNFMSGT